MSAATSSPPENGFEPLVAREDSASRAPLEAATTDDPQALMQAEHDFFVSSAEAEKKNAYERGRADGQRETLAAMSGKLEEQMQQWRSTIASLEHGTHAALTEFFEKIEARAASVGVALAKKILGAEVRAQPDLLIGRIREALTRYRAEPIVSVFVNPADIVFIERLRQDAKDAVPVVHYESSPDVARGGFIVETSIARFDHTVDAELGKMEQALADLYEPVENQR